MLDGQNFFDKTIINNLITYDKIRKIAIGWGDDDTTRRLLEYFISKTIIIR